MLWSLTPLSTILKFVAVSFIGGGNRSTWRKPPTYHILSNNVVSSTPCHERDLNSQV